MSKFDTHGGYFAPKDYLKVNEGGSHEENPNGGVQIGVDPEGNPNLLEEGEPVYKDYVYSDNIYADGGILEKHNLPKKYGGKLYSWIADDILSEAEERPLDPISRNGLEALLGRAAEAQEEQKQLEQQRELEEELAKLSPEELEQLEAMLAQSEQPEVPQDQMIPEEQVGPAMPVEQAPVEMPMMCNGGFIRKFDDGGPLGEGNIEDNLDDILARIQAANALRSSYDESVRDLNAAKGDLSRTKIGYYLTGRNSRNTSKAISNLEDKLVQMLSTLSENKGGIYTDPESSYSRAMKTSIQKTSDALKKARERQAKYDARLAKKQGAIDEAQSKVDKSFAALQAMSSGLPYTYTPPTARGDSSPVPVQATDSIVTAPLVMRRDTFAMPTYTPADSAAWIRDYDEIADLNNMSSITEPQNYEVKPNVTAPAKLSGGLGHIVEGYNEDSFGGYARGGKMNRYDDGGWAKFLEDLNNYSISRDRSNAQGMYRVDRGFPLYGYKDIYALEQSDPYKAFTQYVLNNPDDENVQKYLRALDAGTADWTEKLFDGDTLKSNWKTLYDDRRNDQKGGIYHFSGAWDNLDDLGSLARKRVAAIEAPVGPYQVTGPKEILHGIPSAPTQYELFPGQYAMLQRAMMAKDANPQGGDTDIDENPYGYSPLPTWPRYAGAIGSGLLGLYNVFQSPDKYRQRQLQPYLPEGRIHLQNQVYNPIDQNMVANAISAQGNATARALRNSGLGPSSASAILAADNNTTGNLGTGFLQTWDANNQRRNAVIAANNQAEAQRANFDWTVDAARKKILNDTAYINGYNDMNVQRLNYGAEGDKYAAISNQIANGLQALSGIGKENFAMNQVNSNRAFLGYGAGPNGWMLYNPDYLEYLKNKEKGK